MILVLSMSDRPSFLLVKDNNVLCEFLGEEGNSTAFFVALERDLKKHGLSIEDLDAIVLDAGPGSFTGLRISFAAVKVWAFLYRHIRVYSVSNLSVWAREGLIVVRPAGRGNVYAMRNEDGRCEFFLIPESSLEEIGKPVIWAQRMEPKMLWHYFQKNLSTLTPSDVETLLPLYIYPDDCSVHKT